MARLAYILRDGLPTVSIGLAPVALTPCAPLQGDKFDAHGD